MDFRHKEVINIRDGKKLEILEMVRSLAMFKMYVLTFKLEILLLL